MKAWNNFAAKISSLASAGMKKVGYLIDPVSSTYSDCVDKMHVVKAELTALGGNVTTSYNKLFRISGEEALSTKFVVIIEGLDTFDPTVREQYASRFSKLTGLISGRFSFGLNESPMAEPQPSGHFGDDSVITFKDYRLATEKNKRVGVEIDVITQNISKNKTEIASLLTEIEQAKEARLSGTAVTDDDMRAIEDRAPGKAAVTPRSPGGHGGPS